VKLGDKITGINAVGVLTRGVVDLIIDTEAAYTWHDWPGMKTLSKLRDADVTWICGWHSDDSAEAQALLAAWKLRPPRAMDLFVADRLYQEGKIDYDAWLDLNRWDAAGGLP